MPDTWAAPEATNHGHTGRRASRGLQARAAGLYGSPGGQQGGRQRARTVRRRRQGGHTCRNWDQLSLGQGHPLPAAAPGPDTSCWPAGPARAPPVSEHRLRGPRSGILPALGHLTHGLQSEGTGSPRRWTVSMATLYVNLCEGGGSEGGKRPGPWAGWSVHSGLPPLQLCQDGLPSLGRGQKLCPPPAGPGLPAQGDQGLPWPSYSTLQSWGAQSKGGALRHPEVSGAMPSRCSPGRRPEAGGLCRKVLSWREDGLEGSSPSHLCSQGPSEEAHPGPGQRGGPGRFRSPWSCPGDRQVERAGRPQGRDLGPHRADRQGGQELGHRPGGGGWGGREQPRSPSLSASTQRPRWACCVHR